MANYTTLDNVLSWLKIGPSQPSDNTLLESLIASASAWIDRYVHRGILQATTTQIFNGRDEYALSPFYFPITSVSAVSIDNVPIQAATSAAMYGYTFDDKFVYLRGYRFCSGIQNVSITYTGGYVGVPSDLQQACTSIVGHWYKARDHIGFLSETTQGLETSSYDKLPISPDSIPILDAYRKVTL